jgi:hypothetical protein
VPDDISREDFERVVRYALHVVGDSLVERGFVPIFIVAGAQGNRALLPCGPGLGMEEAAAIMRALLADIDAGRVIDDTPGRPEAN